MSRAEPGQRPAHSPAPAEARPERASAFDRAGRYFADKGWAHLILLCGVGVFLFPLLWMLSTSLKTDEELSTPTAAPTLPTFRARSPDVREAPALQRPDYAPDAAWRELLPQLQSAAAAVVDPLPAPEGAASIDLPALHQSACAVLVNQNVARLNRDLWKGPAPAVLKTFTALLKTDDAKSAMDDRLARLELKKLQVRTLDAHIHAINPLAGSTAGWRIVSGPADLFAAGADGAWLRYDFSTADQPVVVEYAFDFPARAEDFHKLLVSLKEDDSWHRLDATVDVGPNHFTSDQTHFIAQHRATSLIYQPPSFDDQTYKARTWIPLIPVQPQGPAAASATRPTAVLRLTLSPSSTPRAILGKVYRNYARAFYQIPFWTYITNSVLLVALTMGGALFSASFVAYAFARLNWPGRSVAFVLLLATMMLPSQVTMIPSFMIWRSLNWYNTLNPLWVPSWFGSAFFIFLMTQHMKTIPKELEEAARIDGLNAVQTWYYIILPQVKPTLAAIAIMTFQGAWNEFMGPLIYLRDQGKFPLSLGLYGMRLDGAVDWPMLMAGNMLMTLPVIIIFFLFQRYFIQGMTMSGMKG